MLVLLSLGMEGVGEMEAVGTAVMLMMEDHLLVGRDLVLYYFIKYSSNSLMQ